MKSIVFDIETAPLSGPMLDLVMPQFQAPSNFKDQAKIDAHVQSQKEEWVAGAALSPLTGRVLCIGMITPVGFSFIETDDEAQLLRQFWGKLCLPEYQHFPVIGFNIEHFDLPFLIRRSFRHGIKPSVQCFRGRYLSDRFIDLMKLWQLGDYRDFISLNTLAKFLGVGEKTGSGADFAKLWETDRKQAIEYLKRDCELTLGCAEKMGVNL